MLGVPERGVGEGRFDDGLGGPPRLDAADREGLFEDDPIVRARQLEIHREAVIGLGARVGERRIDPHVR